VFLQVKFLTDAKSLHCCLTAAAAAAADRSGSWAPLLWRLRVAISGADHQATRYTVFALVYGTLLQQLHVALIRWHCSTSARKHFVYILPLFRDLRHRWVIYTKLTPCSAVKQLLIEDCCNKYVLQWSLVVVKFWWHFVRDFLTLRAIFKIFFPKPLVQFWLFITR